MLLKAPQSSLREDIISDFPTITDLKAFLTQAKAQFFNKWESKDIPRANPKDFEHIKSIGEGSYGKVMLVKHKSTDTYYAMKALNKAEMVSRKQINHAYSEMKILLSIRYPFLVYMTYVMKDYSYIYFILPFIVGGEMFGLLQKLVRFTEDQTKFYAVQVCLALEYLHFLDILYRDLKPENILIDRHGYLKITDMGFSKVVKGRTYTFCGTPEYLAPEIILQKGYSKSVDWWSYGILLYEMSTGYTPFYAQNTMTLYEKIVRGKYKFASVFSIDLKALVSDILQVDPTKRLGSLKNGVNDIKNHRWFKNINWLSILNYKINAPYLPKYSSQADTAHFDDIVHNPLIISDTNNYEKEFEKF